MIHIFLYKYEYLRLNIYAKEGAYWPLGTNHIVQKGSGSTFNYNYWK